MEIQNLCKEPESTNYCIGGEYKIEREGEADEGTGAGDTDRKNRASEKD